MSILSEIPRIYKTCYVKPSDSYHISVPKSMFIGVPVEPREINATPAADIPESYVLTHPKQGQLEIACAVSDQLPGHIHTTGAGVFGTNHAIAHLFAAHSVSPGEATRLRISAFPRISAFMEHRDGFSYYIVALKLSASSALLGASSWVMELVANHSGEANHSESFNQRRVPITTIVDVNPDDIVTITLSLHAYVQRSVDSGGNAMVDIEGLLSPPGKYPSSSNGGLSIDSFHIHDVDSQIDCSPVFKP